MFAFGLWARLKGIQAPLNEDESLFAMQNLIPLTSFHEWWSTLEHPILFYMIGKLTVALGGYNFVALRASSIVAGLGLIWMCWLLGRKLGDWPTGLAAAFLAATSFTMIGYSQVYLPYAFSFLATAGLAYAALWALDNLTWRRAAVLIGLSILSSFSAHTSLLAEGGVGFVLLASLFFKERTGKRITGAAVYLGWLAAAGLIMIIPAARLIFVPPGAGYVTDVYQDSYWATLGFWGGLERIVSSTMDVIVRYVPLAGLTVEANIVLALFVLTAVIGLSAAWKTDKGRFLVLFLIGTVLAQTAAMAVGMWSLRAKHSLYLAPLFLLFLGHGAAVVGGWIKENRYWPAAVLGLLILAMLPLRAAVKPNMTDDVVYGWNGFIGKMEKNLKDGDAVFVDTYSAPMLLFKYFPDRVELAEKLHRERRRLYPNHLIPNAVQAGWSTLFGKKVFLVLGGEDINMLEKSGANQIWILYDRKYERTRRNQFKPNLSPAFKLEDHWSAEGENGCWMVYGRIQ